MAPAAPDPAGPEGRVAPTDAQDTIVAVATPPGHGALAVLRLSGPGSRELVARLCPGGPAWRPRRASLRRARDEDAVLDEVLVTWMPGPGSVTGEDVVEVSTHGNPLLVQAVQQRLVALGARPARPGEFTRRAVEHGRLDLVQAEAVAAVVAARSLEGARLALAGLDGALGRRLAAWRERWLDLAAELEARLDHPDEELATLPEAELVAELEADSAALRDLAATWARSRPRLQGARVALRGPVNVGKSSLFNALLEQERALVSDEAGTTRDVVSAWLDLDGLPVELMDTAGERAEARGLEAAGQVLGARLSAEADLHLWLCDLRAPPQPPPEGEVRRLVVGTHLDRVSLEAGPPAGVDLAVSSTTGAGLPALRRALREALARAPLQAQEAVVLSARQHALCLRLGDHLAEAAGALLLGAGPAVAASELTLALEALAELDGQDVREAVLDRVFARFCIGK